MNKKPIILAMTGASGSIYAVRLLEVLLAAGYDVHLTISSAGRLVIEQELDVSVDLETKQLVGAGGVEGAIPAGTFSADRLTADLSARTVTLTGNARLRMEPGKLRMP